MNGKRWKTWIVVGSLLAGSCAVDERGVTVPGGIGADGSDAGGLGSELPRLEVNPPSVDLGWVTTGFASRARLTLRNTGGAPLPAPVFAWSAESDADFVVIQNLCEGEIGPGLSCEVRLQVVPSRAGALQGTLQVQGTTGTTDIGVSALGMQAGELILAPAAGSFEDFGGVVVGAVQEGVFTLSNPGGVSTGPLQLAVNRPEFAFVAPEPGGCINGTTALEPGQACSVRLAFAPVARGPVDATLTIPTQNAGSVSLTLAGRGLVPGVLDTSVTALDFQGVLLLQSARRSVTFTNGGDQPLTLDGVSLAPADAPGFTIYSSDCATALVLDSGQSCSVEVEFRPLVPDQELSAELVASYVGAVQPSSIPLRGIGLVPGSLQVGPITAGEENFGDVLVGESLERSFQVVNPGAQPSGVLDWTIGDGFEVATPPAAGECEAGVTSLVDGQSCGLRIRFSPQRREPASGSLLVTSALTGAVGAPVAGRGIIAAQIRAEPEVNFGRVLTAASAERTLTISNTGDQPLLPPALALSGADPSQVAAFTFQSGCVEPLALGQECTVTLAFAPTVAVPHSASLQLTSEASTPASVLLLGEALVPGSLVVAPAEGSAVAFGDVALGTTSSQSFTLTNPGAVASGPLTITTDNNQFEVVPGDCNGGDPAGLIDGSSCTFSVSFTPADSLSAAANVSVQSPGAGRAGIAISGRGRAKASLSATGNRDLGRANIGQAALTAAANEFAWTVNNTGDLATGALVVANDNPTEFVVSGDTCGGAALAGLASCQMTIRFRPAATGPRTANIVVSDPEALLSAPLVLTGLGVQLVGPGQSCVNAECATGVCTPTGVCCDRACDRTCEACSAAGVCTELNGGEACGNGAACFGVDECKLPAGSPCTEVGGAEQCGSGFCQPRFSGAGAGDRICCLEQCGPGLACNAQGSCQQTTAGDGAVCGRPGDLPCGAGLLCKQCVGSGAGQSQCKPADACCGTCGGGLECADGARCDCPIGTNGLRGIPCADGCVPRREGACCPEAPACDPGELCDGSDNLCKQCLSSENCQGRACQGGVCEAAQCTPGQRLCFDGAPQLCSDSGLRVPQQPCGTGQECDASTGQCACTSGTLCGNGCVDLQTDENNCGGCGNLCGTQCLAGICQVERGPGDACPDGVCGGNSICSAGICCDRDCDAPCETCSTGTCQFRATSEQCDPVVCDTSAVDPACLAAPRRPPPAAIPPGEGVCGALGECAGPADICPQPEPERTPCTDLQGQQGICIQDILLFCNAPRVQCGNAFCNAGQFCCVSDDVFECSNTPCPVVAGFNIFQLQCNSDQDCAAGTSCCLSGNTVSCEGNCLQRLCDSPEPSLSLICPSGQSCNPLPGVVGWSACGVTL